MTPGSPSTTTVYLRRLIAEIAPLMQALYTFEGIADPFYEVGVIDRPERPYGVYDGNKRDYAREKLNDADDLGLFLKITVPTVIVEADVEGLEIKRAVHAMKALGYRQTARADEFEIAEYEAPDPLPLTTNRGSGKLAAAGGDPSRRIDIPDLPPTIQALIDELDDSLDRGHANAAALLTRKIIQEAVFIAMHRNGKSADLKDVNGDDVDLSLALQRCKQALGVSAQVVGRVTQAKWIGDSANHSFRVKVTSSDLDVAITGVRLFLQEVL